MDFNEVELYDDNDLLRGDDGGDPPAADEPPSPGPVIESIHSDDDPADVPVPDMDDDSDLDDDFFFTKWLEEIKADEYPVVPQWSNGNGGRQAPTTADQRNIGHFGTTTMEEVGAKRLRPQSELPELFWEPHSSIELDSDKKSLVKDNLLPIPRIS